MHEIFYDYFRVTGNIDFTDHLSIFMKNTKQKQYFSSSFEIYNYLPMNYIPLS